MVTPGTSGAAIVAVAVAASTTGAGAAAQPCPGTALGAWCDPVHGNSFVVFPHSQPDATGSLSHADGEAVGLNFSGCRFGCTFTSATGRLTATGLELTARWAATGEVDAQVGTFTNRGCALVWATNSSPAPRGHGHWAVWRRGTLPPRPPPFPPPPPPPAPAPKNAMNVLMIAIDDLRPESSAHGHEYMRTPNLERLAAKSTLFTRAYVQVALCMPSRNALLFSRRPDTAQAWEIASTQWPRTCGGRCAGNQCGRRTGSGPSCGIREPGPAGKLAVTLPGWFLANGFFTSGAGKIFHEGGFTELQDFRHSWTPSTTNPRSGLFDPPFAPNGATYRGKRASPTWFAFDVEDDATSETQLAVHTAAVIRNLSDAAAGGAGVGVGSEPQPFFIAVGFHKPHVPWYAPRRYFDMYPSGMTTLAPSRGKPVGAPNIGMQAVAGMWANPIHAGGLDCSYTDLCGECYAGSPFADGRPVMTREYPFDNTTFPEWKELEIRRAYRACVSFTDANIGRVLDALDESVFANNTVVALWGDHGYHLGDNDMWAKHSNFEHAVKIPLMIHVPGLPPGRTDALVSAVDLFPTLVAAATLRSPGGPVSVARCPADVAESRATALCTEGFDLMPLLSNATGGAWPRAAFSQYVRGANCCDCPPPGSSRPGAGGACCECPGFSNQTTMRGCDPYHPRINTSSDCIPWLWFPGPTMGYTVRVDRWRYTAWVPFNQTTATPDWANVLAAELYAHNESNWPVDFAVETRNVVSDPASAAVARRLHTAVVECGQRPDLCSPALLAGLVH